MTVDVRVIVCGMRSGGGTSRKELTSRIIHGVCMMSIFLKVGREIMFQIYDD